MVRGGGVCWVHRASRSWVEVGSGGVAKARRCILPLGIIQRIRVGARGKEHRLMGKDRQAGAGLSSDAVRDRLEELVP